MFAIVLYFAQMTEIIARIVRVQVMGQFGPFAFSSLSRNSEYLDGLLQSTSDAYDLTNDLDIGSFGKP